MIIFTRNVSATSRAQKIASRIRGGGDPASTHRYSTVERAESIRPTGSTATRWLLPRIVRRSMYRAAFYETQPIAKAFFHQSAAHCRFALWDQR